MRSVRKERDVESERERERNLSCFLEGDQIQKDKEKDVSVFGEEAQSPRRDDRDDRRSKRRV